MSERLPKLLEEEEMDTVQDRRNASNTNLKARQSSSRKWICAGIDTREPRVFLFTRKCYSKVKGKLR